ncbi:MAG: hypothetical protein JNK24_06530 [Alphaproteobacteria bacterium]|nr:hypothetical protein [Alphaproteobacteria bacterium]
MVKGVNDKIIIFIIVLMALAGGSGYGLYTYILPEVEKKSTELQGVKGYVDQKYQEVAKMKEEFVLLQSQLRDFKELEANGFFNNQDRADAVANFSKLVDRVGILKAVPDYASGALINNQQAEDAAQVLIKSHGKVDIEAIEDVDIYTLLKFMQERYPGSVDITKFSVERMGPLTAATLRDIGGGHPKPLLKGSFEFDWRTMTAKTDIKPQVPAGAK